MRDHGSWSVSLGRWGGLTVRVHMVFLLFAAFALYFSWQERQAPQGGDAAAIAALSLGVLFLSVLLHELGHYQAALRLGGGGDRIVLGPLGGLAPLSAPRDPRAELIVYLAGPLVNCLVCLVSVAVLSRLGVSELARLLHPLRPPNGADGALPALLQFAFWINWVLLLVNAAPAFPFDGGRILRAGMLLLWPSLSRRDAAVAVARFAKLVSAGLLILACFLRGPRFEGLLPPWFVLVLFAIFLFFSAKQEENHDQEQDGEEAPLGYDFSQGYTTLEQGVAAPRLRQGAVARWLERRRRARRRRRLRLEEEEERRVDEILSRLHQQGMQSLSGQDRSLLERVSERYRNRLGPRA